MPFWNEHKELKDVHEVPQVLNPKREDEVNNQIHHSDCLHTRLCGLGQCLYSLCFICPDLGGNCLLHVCVYTQLNASLADKRAYIYNTDLKNVRVGVGVAELGWVHENDLQRDKFRLEVCEVEVNNLRSVSTRVFKLASDFELD